MTSAAKIEANRRNAQRSTGPRSKAGKARVARNSFKHGLSVAIGADDFHAECEELVRAFEGELDSAKNWEQVSRFVEGQIEVLRVRRSKAELLNRAASRLKTLYSDMEECVAAGFVQNAKLLQSFERYERRALSKRRRALGKLARTRAARPHSRPVLERAAAPPSQGAGSTVASGPSHGNVWPPVTRGSV